MAGFPLGLSAALGLPARVFLHVGQRGGGQIAPFGDLLQGVDARARRRRLGGLGPWRLLGFRSLGRSRLVGFRDAARLGHGGCRGYRRRLLGAGPGVPPLEFLELPRFLFRHASLLGLRRLGQVPAPPLCMRFGRLRGRLLRLVAEQLRLVPLLRLAELRLFAWFVHVFIITEIRKIIALLRQKVNIKTLQRSNWGGRGSSERLR